MSCIVRAALVVLVAVLPLRAGAWGFEAHRLIAEAAERQLTPEAKAEVDRLLALEPGATFVSISTWADEHKSRTTAKWHYVNFARDEDCRYVPERNCSGASCVVGAIERQVAVLSSDAPDEERLKALKYVVHFVADAHQPLHGGYGDDRGGNTYQVQAFGRGTNLHAVWDTLLIEQWPGGDGALRDAVARAKVSADTSSAPGRWVEESCRIVATEGFYPAGHKIDVEYGKRWDATLAAQIADAAKRLAAVLNQGLAGR